MCTLLPPYVAPMTSTFGVDDVKLMLQLLVVPGAGHFLMWEAADTFNRITAAFCRP